LRLIVEQEREHGCGRRPRPVRRRHLGRGDLNVVVVLGGGDDDLVDVLVQRSTPNRRSSRRAARRPRSSS